MKDFLVALGIILMILPVLLYVREIVRKEKVLFVPIVGEIDSFSGKIYAEALKEGKDERYEIIVLEVDSPGGTYSGIIDVINAIKGLKEENKTVLCYVKEALSGAYWIASYCDRIFAEEGALVGNIGVSASFINLHGLFQRFNISYIEIYNGSLKEMGNPFKQPAPEEIERLKEIVNKLYENFLSSVAANRNLTAEEVKEIKTSNIFLAPEAIKMHLVDEIGNLDSIEEYIKQKFNKKEIEFVYPRIFIELARGSI